MRNDIRGSFEANLKRVEHLVGLYQMLTTGGPGRRPVHSTDILRAATVLLHASFEELLRRLIVLKYPNADEGVLNDVPLAGMSTTSRPEKFFLGKLVAYRGKSVDEVIQLSVAQHVNTFSASSVNEVCGVLTRLKFDITYVQNELPALADLISRRHAIVHQADRNEREGSGHHRTRSLSEETVLEWHKAVWTLGTIAIDHLEP
ncbi:MAG: hypothetical protein HYZ13_03145 [Acidobacteria bacterium]|nr:hypothetical protein [Acidobacteriota bacterium]